MKNINYILAQLSEKKRVRLATADNAEDADKLAKIVNGKVGGKKHDGKIVVVKVIPDRSGYNIELELSNVLPCGGEEGSYCPTCRMVHTPAISGGGKDETRQRRDAYADAMMAFHARAKLRRDAYTIKGDDLKSGHKGAIIGSLNEAFGGDENRHLALAWLFDYNNDPPIVKKSSKTLTNGQWLALKEWLNADPDNNFEPSDEFLRAAKQISIIAQSVSRIDPDKFYEDRKKVFKDKNTQESLGLGGEIVDEGR
jgi:hypothetical protein